jgi:methylated-DNA-[protein]-cysteine S-methyltransferase
MMNKLTNQMIKSIANKYVQYQSVLGPLTLVTNEFGLTGVFFEDHAHHTHHPAWQRVASHPILQMAINQLDEYFHSSRTVFDLPLAVETGTEFQRQVWQALRDIPYGETMSYGELAKQIGRPRAVRALGAANGRNPLSIIVPCHRVIASNGNLHGYAGGLENKRKLLELEKKNI